jgi:hypothetical protein
LPSTPDKIPIRFYKDFLETDWPSFSVPVQEALSKFLQLLEINPENMELIGQSARDKKGRYAFSFYPGYAIYWRLIRAKPGLFLTLKSFEIIRIEVLAVLKA